MRHDPARGTIIPSPRLLDTVMNRPAFKFAAPGLAVLAALALAACGTTKVMETWDSDTVEPRKPEKVAVLAVWPDELQRLVIERDMVAKMRASGANAVESSELPGMRGELTREKVASALRAANADAAVIVFVIGGGGGDSYERSDYWAQYVGSGVGYGWYSPYYASYYDVYVVREGPGYAEQTTQLFLEASYIDVARLERVWSIVTRSKDVEYQDVTAKITERVISQMKKHDQL